jgi:hypothetical protein
MEGRARPVRAARAYLGMTRNRAISGAAFAAALAGLAALGAQQGCTVLTNDAPPDDAGVFEGGEADGAAAVCGACVVQQCAGPLAACLTDDACVEVSLCAKGGAGATACACGAGTDGGADGGPSAAAAFRASYECERERKCSQCASSCACGAAASPLGSCDDAGSADAGDDGAAADAGSADAGDAGADAGDAGATADAGGQGVGSACASCAASQCGDAARACGVGTECEAFLVCMRDCSSAACAAECAATRATGKTAASELARCTTTSCNGPCGF